jgi:hypothetical protein
METLIIIALYFLPAIVAAIRHHPNQNAIFIQNLLLGWTIIGWIIALIWANTFVARRDRLSPFAVKYDPMSPMTAKEPWHAPLPSRLPQQKSPGD